MRPPFGRHRSQNSASELLGACAGQLLSHAVVATSRETPARLDQLVELAEQAGERTSRKEIVGVCIMGSPSNADELIRRIRLYRRTPANGVYTSGPILCQRARAPTRPTRPPAPTMAPANTANLTRDTTTDRKTLSRFHNSRRGARHQTNVVFPPEGDSGPALNECRVGQYSGMSLDPGVSCSRAPVQW
jgi:hypothetical protein